jgi:hypothetical protein
MKIYSDDPNLPYKTTRLNAQYTRTEIDSVLAKWGVRDSGWRWDPEHNDVFIEFKLVETIGGREISSWVRVVAPAVWDHKTRNKAEEINWNISLRVMFWFIKSHLEAAYLMQSEKTVAFLPYITTGEGGETVAKKIIHNLEKIQGMPALPEFPVLERGGS